VSPDFILGVMVGFVFATFFGYVLGQIQRARSISGAPGRPQVVVTPTRMTPREVMGEAFRAGLAVIGWTIVLGAGTWFFIAMILFGGG
jgi:hypothetical protein